MLTETLIPISMEQAVGYDALDCGHQAAVEDAIVLTHDRLFMLLDTHGNVAPPGRCGLGLFHDDTRILSHYGLEFTSGEPVLLSGQVVSPYRAIVDLAVNDREFGGDAWDPKNVIHIRRDILLDDRLVERVTITNFMTRTIDFRLRLALGCDFADIFEVRGWKRAERGRFYRPDVGPDCIVFSYQGRDGSLIRSMARFREPPTETDPDGATWRLPLEPGRRVELQWEIGPADSRQAVEPEWRTPGERGEHLRDLYREWRSRCASWRTDVMEFNATLDQAVDDLRALYTTTADDRVITAGIPWYSTAFGRDSIIASLQTLPLNPGIAVDTLRYLARHQGRKEDPYTEEQPGRIMHELRRGEMARAGEIPHLPYYGTIDATPLWLVLLHETWRWTGDRALIEPLLPHAERALDWIDRYGDADGDGFVEYARTSAEGLVNQGWKDSGDGVPFPDGRLPAPPIALVEVQGYVYDAKRRMAMLFDAFGRPERGEALRREATALRQRIHERFWLEEAGTFALALDGEKRPIPTITSNAGHLLWSRVPTGEQARRMADVLADSRMRSGWGIRTLAAGQAVYNPMSYHNGSVWPHDNALVVLGLSLYGLAGSTLPVLEGLHDAANNMRPQRLPELFCGMIRGGAASPVLYPVSCSPQAWASGAFFMLLQGVLGILPDAPDGTLHIREPVLPTFLRELTISGLSIGRSRVSFQFRRHRDRTLANLLSVEGEPLRIRMELS